MNSEAWGEKSGWINLLLPFGIMILPAAIGIAILRYRLWDIDLLIRRTLVYSILTVILGLMYLGAVTLTQNLFTYLSGSQSSAAIVLSTLFIAALFNPLRSRVQGFIDRRFYRSKYNAEMVLDTFSSKVREGINLPELSGYLQYVVQETMQSNHVSLWITRVGKSRDR